MEGKGIGVADIMMGKTKKIKKIRNEEGQE